MKKLSSGFTLIELLIVVAIIAILAAIAVPNFLEAQTRAKISRVKAELRTMGTAIETYTIDHNKQPLDYAVTKFGDPPIPGVTNGSVVSGILHPGCRLPDGSIRAGLSTPIAYITNAWVQDPFIGKGGGNIDYDQQVYSYHPLWKGTLWGRAETNMHTTYRNNNYFEHYGTYRLGSIGPDRTFYTTNVPGDRVTLQASTVYDASNGTVSFGNIWRSQKSSEENTRPRLDIAANPNG